MNCAAQQRFKPVVDLIHRRFQVCKPRTRCPTSNHTSRDHVYTTSAQILKSRDIKHQHNKHVMHDVDLDKNSRDVRSSIAQRNLLMTALTEILKQCRQRLQRFERFDNSCHRLRHVDDVSVMMPPQLTTACTIGTRRHYDDQQ